MSSPFTVLRRNQKSILAVSGILIMFVFVVGDYITRQGNDDRNPARTKDEVVVRWKGGSATEMELQRAMLIHRYTLGFLAGVVQETRENKGTPRVRNVNQESPGITPAQGLEGIFQKRVLAAKAAEMGIVISDDAVLEFLDRLSDGLLKKEDFERLLSRTLGPSSERRVTPAQVFEQLKQELAGENLVQFINAGMGAHTPVAAWNNFNRLNRRVKLEVLPLKVEDFKAQVKQEPKEAELKELYEKHKADFGHPQIPTPGFRQWKQVAFEYFKIEFDKFLAEELPKVTDAEIQKEYDEGVARGEYRVQELPAADVPKKEDAPKAEADDKKSDDKKDDKKEEPKADAPKSDAPKTDTPKPETKDVKPEEKKADDKKPADKPADAPKLDAPKTDAPKTEAPKPDAPKPEPSKDEKKDGSSQLNRPLGNGAQTFFVSTADDKTVESAKADEKKADEKKADDKKPDEKKEEKKPEEKPAESKPDAKKEDKPEAKPTPESKPADDKKDDKKPAADKADDKKPEDKKPDDAKPEDKPKVKPLAEVRDEVARRVAKPRAQEAKKKVMAELKKKLLAYGRDRRIWEKFKDTKDSGPEPKLDMEALAAQMKVSFGKTGLLTEITAGENDLGKAVSLFNQKAFREPNVLLYQPNEPEFEEDLTYLWWKTEEKPDRVPEYKEARDAVVDAWKRAEAFKLAKKAAEDKIRDAKGKPTLKEAFGEAVVETNTFSWMTGGNVSFGFGMPMLSAVEKIEHPGRDFMQKVFESKLGDVSFAINDPQTFVYVFRVAEEATKESERREMFLTSGNSFAVRSMWFGEHRQALNQWYRDVEKEMQVMWRDRPQDSGDDE